MAFVIVGCIAGIFVVEMLGYSICQTRIRKPDNSDGVQMCCEVDGHTYVVNAPNYSRACQCWVAFAADPDCNFSWHDAALMKRLTKDLFATLEKTECK